MSASNLGRLGVAMLTATALLAVPPPASAATPPAPQPGPLKGPGVSKRDKLGSHDRELLVKAVRDGKKAVTALLAVAPGQFDAARKAVESAGGRVTAANAKVGYLRASVPTAAVDTVAQKTSVLAVDLDEKIKLADPVPAAEGRRGGGTASAPGKRTPAANPYLPVRETGATDFVKAHPAWDGRGTTIGILDTGIDLDHPALATTTSGETKIVDWVTATDPLTEGDGTWVELTETVTATPEFTYGGSQQYTAPAAGSYRFSLFNERATAGPNEVNGDVNRDGDTWDSFGVLYRESDHAVWVDSDADHSFADEPLLRPYREGRKAGHFGTDNPATDVHEELPFTIETRQGVDLTPVGRTGTADFVSIGLPAGAHGTHVAGIAAGRGLFGGAMSGAAPGAQLVSARACTWDAGCTAVALTEGMIDLVVNRHVDVVNMSIGGLPALNDGANARAYLYNTLIRDYGVQLFLSAGNSGPGLNTVGDPSVASDVVSVGASVSRETWAADYGSQVGTKYGMFAFSSRGPREEGGFKPNIVAPGAAVSTTPMWLPGAPVSGVGYDLPAGYSMFNGTSMAAPQATGAAALLLSAAKATRTSATPAQLRAAIYDSAKFLPGVPAHQQGNGLFAVGGAWQALAAGGLATGSYKIDAQVCTPLSGYLATPGRGEGLYDRCGGVIDPVQDVTITRTGGAPRDELHTLGWTGNDGTFANLSGVVRLPLGKPVTVPVQVYPRGNGVHSAILLIDSPGTKGIDARMLATVATSDELAAPTYQRTQSGSVDRAQVRSYLVTVPERARTLQIKLDGVPAGDRVRFTAQHPYGVPAETGCYTGMDTPGCDPHVRSIKDPLPGVWEITVEAARTSPAEHNPYRLTVNAFAATAKADAVLGTLELHEKAPVSWEVTNHLGKVSLAASTSPLSSRQTKRPVIGNHEQQPYDVTVPIGATRFTARIGKPADPAADLDLFVTLDGVVIGASADGDSEESVVLDNPPPGVYTVWVVGYAVPSGSTAFDYTDEVSTATVGKVATTFTAPLAFDRGQTRTVTAEVTATGTPPSGRTLYGALDLVNTDGAVVGQAGVTIAGVHAPSLRVTNMFGPMAVFGAADSVAVGSAQVDGVSRPSRWTPQGGITHYDGYEGHILGVNRKGDGVGQSEHADKPAMAAVFHADGTVTELPMPPWVGTDVLYARAFAANDAGVVVGNVTSWTQARGWRVEAFRWTAEAGYVRLPHLTEEPDQTQPLGVNSSGVVVGSSKKNGVAVACWWDSNGGVHEIGALQPGTSSVLHEINDSGTAVGESGSHAAIWTAAGGLRALPDFGFNSSAMGINKAGWIIGQADMAPYDTHVVAWDPQGRLWDLSAMMPPDQFYPNEAVDVTDDGAFVVYGQALDGSDRTHAVLRF
ncbi:S8 family serine peptidase [Micromonospora purpureochromogenes]